MKFKVGDYVVMARPGIGEEYLEDVGKKLRVLEYYSFNDIIKYEVVDTGKIQFMFDWRFELYEINEEDIL